MNLSTIIEVELKYQGQLDQDFKEWLFPRGSQPNRGFFCEEDKQESTYIDRPAPDGEMRISRYPDRAVSTMVVVKLSEKVEGLGDKIDASVCGVFYK